MPKKTSAPKPPDTPTGTPTPTQLGFFSCQSKEPDHVAPYRPWWDKLRSLARANDERGKRPYVLPDWVEPYLERVTFVKDLHRQYKNAKIEREILDRIARKEDPPIDGLPVGEQLIRKALDMKARADQSK
jgi:hypothetical protein